MKRKHNYRVDVYKSDNKIGGQFRLDNDVYEIIYRLKSNTIQIKMNNKVIDETDLSTDARIVYNEVVPRLIYRAHGDSLTYGQKYRH